MMIFGRLWEVFNWVFPLNCLGCGREDAVVCEKCRVGVRVRRVQECPYCRRESAWGLRCVECRDGVGGNLDGLICLWNYEKAGLLAKLLHFYKYQGWAECGVALKKMFGEEAGRMLGEWRAAAEVRLDLVTWAPMSVRKFRKRGFNQSEELARSILADLRQNSAVLEELLEKTRETSSQMTLKREERLKNLEGSFRLKTGKALVTGKNVLIIDDIATTLATLEEAAKVLKMNGASKVFALVAARQKW